MSSVRSRFSGTGSIFNRISQISFALRFWGTIAFFFALFVFYLRALHALVPLGNGGGMSYLRASVYELAFRFDKPAAAPWILDDNFRLIGVARHPAYLRLMHIVNGRMKIAAVWGSFAGVAVLFFGFFLARKEAALQTEDRHRRGSELATPKILNKQLKKSEGEGIIKIGEIILPRQAECRGIFCVGMTGVGKTQLQNRVMDVIVERGDRGIFYSVKGDDYLTTHWRYGDAIFCPADQRCLGWNLMADITDLADFEIIANSLVVQDEKIKTWSNGARMIVSGLLKFCYLSGQRSNKQIAAIFGQGAAEMRDCLRRVPGAEQAAGLLADPNSAPANSFYITVCLFSRPLQLLKHLEGDWSISRWIKEGTGRIYLPATPRLRDQLGGLYSVFFDLAIVHHLSLPKDPERRIRAVILAVTVSLTPFLSLLILTPFMSRAVKFVFGSFVFLTIWGVTDAVLHQFIIDYSNKLYADVRQYSLGLDALRFFPPSTEKVLALFGMVRASGLVLAGAITSGVLGLGGSVGAAIGGKIAGEVTASGAQGEQQMLDPGAKASIRKSNQMAVPTEAMANNNAWNTRQAAEYSQQSGGLQQQLGSVEGAGGMSNYEKMRHGQGVTSSYRSQGDNALNQEFVRQAESMGVPRAEAQKMAAATVNHGEGLAELRRLQGQGFTGQQASDTYWQGKTVDHMQGKSVGQQDGFTMYRPVEGQDVGKWGQTSATWQGGNLVGLQGNTVNVATSDQIRTNYDKAYSQSISESYKADQSLGESITKSWGNSGTWSKINAAAQQLYSATSGSVDISKSVNSSIMSSIRDSTAVDERTGQTIDKSAWAQITGGAGTPKISPIKAGVEAGASWRVTTSDGKSYLVHQSAEEAKSLQQTVGQNWRTTTSDVRSGQYSSTAQAALTQVESVMGSKTAAETATVSYQRADEMRENQGQSHSRAADISASLARDFYHYVGEQQFGGGAAGDREAIRHLEGLAATGKTAEIGKLKDQYFVERNINLDTLGAEMPKLKGPDMSKSPDPEAIKSKIEDGKTVAETVLATQPNINATDPTGMVGKKLQTKPGAVDPKEIKAAIDENQQAIKTGKTDIEAKGVEIKKTPPEKLHSAAADAGKKSGEKVAEIISAAGETVPGKIVGGLVDAVPKIMAGLDSVGQEQSPAEVVAPVQPETVKPVPAAPMPAQQTATILAEAVEAPASVQSETVKPVPAAPMPAQQTATILAEAVEAPASVQSETVKPVPAEPMPAQPTAMIQAKAVEMPAPVQPETVKPVPAEPMPAQSTATILAAAVEAPASVPPETVKSVPAEPMPAQPTAPILAEAVEMQAPVPPETVKPVQAESMPAQSTATLLAAAVEAPAPVPPDTVKPVPAEPMPAQSTATIQAEAVETPTPVQPGKSSKANDDLMREIIQKPEAQHERRPTQASKIPSKGGSKLNPQLQESSPKPPKGGI